MISQNSPTISGGGEMKIGVIKSSKEHGTVPMEYIYVHELPRVGEGLILPEHSGSDIRSIFDKQTIDYLWKVTDVVHRSSSRYGEGIHVPIVFVRS